MYMCTSRFNLEEKQLESLNNFLSEEEKHEAAQENGTEFLDDLDPISDNEEDNVVLVHEQSVTQRLSERATGKRRRSVASEAEDEAQQGARSDDEADIPLPELPSTQQRVSGRNRKCSRRGDDDFVHY